MLLDEAESEPQWWREPMPQLRQYYAELARAIADVNTALAVVKAEAAFSGQLPLQHRRDTSTEVSAGAGAAAPLASPDASLERVCIAIGSPSAPCVAEDAGADAEPRARVLERAAAVLQAAAGVLAVPRASPLDSFARPWARCWRGAAGGCSCFSWQVQPPPVAAGAEVSVLLLDSAVGALVDATVEAAAAPPGPPPLDECPSKPGSDPGEAGASGLLPLRVAAVHALALAVVQAARACKVVAHV